MSSIAQKLCNELCDEDEEPSEIHESKIKGPIPASTNNRYKGKPTSSIIVEKKTEINQVMPRSDSNRNKIIINKFKSKETLLKKKLVDVASNTRASGPLKCDNDCVTIVRRRDTKVCSCGKKRRNVQSENKAIQTFEFKSFQGLDKASALSFKLVNCGIQDELSAIKKPSNVKLVFDIDVQTSATKKKMHDKSSNAPFINNSNVIARKWALSTGRTRGPDF